MKHSFHSLTSGAIWVAAALMEAGCSNEENASATYVAEGTPITVNAIVGEMQTKAGYSEDNMPKQFYLNIKNPNKDKYSYYALMKKNGDTWESFDGKDAANPALAMYWAGDGANVEVTAATFDFSTASEPSVQPDQTTSIDDSDALIMATDKNVSPTTKSIDVKLKHLMSKLIVTVDLGQGVDYTTNPITDFMISGTKTQRAYSFENNTFSDISTSAATDIKAYTDASVTQPTTTNGYIVSYEAILVPQEVVANDLVVSFNLGSKSYKWTSADLITFNSNTQYTLTLKMSSDKLTLGTISLDKWNETTDLGSGTVKSTVKGPAILTVTAVGQVTAEAIANTLNGGSALKIVGPMSYSDVSALRTNTAIESLDLSETTIDDNENMSLGNNKTLKELTLPNTLTAIPEDAFRGCDALTKIVIPSTVQSVGGYAFYNCSALSEVTFTATSQLNSIGVEAFKNCTALTSITLPAGVTVIPNGMFSGCTGIETITCEGNITQVYSEAFADCDNLTLYLTNCSQFPENPEGSGNFSGFKVYVNSTVYDNRHSDDNWSKWRNCNVEVEN